MQLHIPTWSFSMMQWKVDLVEGSALLCNRRPAVEGKHLHVNNHKLYGHAQVRLKREKTNCQMP